MTFDPKYRHLPYETKYDEDNIPTIIWDQINNRKWDCGYTFQITPLITGSFHLHRLQSISSTNYISEDMGKFKSLKEAKQAIADWKLNAYNEWEFKQKNPVITID